MPVPVLVTVLVQEIYGKMGANFKFISQVRVKLSLLKSPNIALSHLKSPKVAMPFLPIWLKSPN